MTTLANHGWALALLAVSAASAASCSAPAPAPVVPELAPVAAPAATPEPVAAPEPPPVVAAPAPPPPPPSPCAAGMVLIPGGEFVVGLFKEKVAVKPFCIDVNEVTSDDYGACVKAGKCDANLLTVCQPSTYNKPGQGKMPIVCVDYRQSETYCAAQGKRLISTVEWEWAARGADEGRKHPWGPEDLGDQLCWSGKTKRDGPCEIGSFPAGDSPQGVKDLLGGTGEWTTLPQDATSTSRIGRGASWKDSEKEKFRVDRGGYFKATYRCGFLGIRCAQPVP